MAPASRNMLLPSMYKGRKMANISEKMVLKTIPN